MIAPLDLVVLAFLVVVAAVALEAPGRWAALAALVFFSLGSALAYAQMGAADVAFTELAVGISLGSLLLVAVRGLGEA